MGRRKKEHEKSCVRTFLERILGQCVLSLRGRAPPRPDISCVIERNGKRISLEVELVEYQVDARVAGCFGSAGERLNSFWQDVHARLRRRLSKNGPNRAVTVTLKRSTAIRGNDARGFAEELAHFVRALDSTVSATETITTFSQEFPLLSSHVQTLRIKKLDFNRQLWTCTNVSAGNVGVCPRIVSNLVSRKCCKKYQWSRKAEKWLLVCASGRSIVAHAGPAIFAERLRDPELLTVCRTSQFDRVYFTDLTRRWHLRLKLFLSSYSSPHRQIQLQPLPQRLRPFVQGGNRGVEHLARF
jgi:hypothetical protein